MSTGSVPKLKKWPFLLGDTLLVGLAAAVVYRSAPAMNPWEALVCLLACVAGAWMGVLPFLREYQAALQLAEAEGLSTAVAQIGNLDQIKNQINNATAHWQTAQEHSRQTVTAAKEITDRMKAELAEFTTFLQRAHETEKNHLKLEVEKLRRGEREWLQGTALVLDHIFALNAAAAKSGQASLQAQLSQFQFACRDALRRVGLMAFAPAVNDAFDPQIHQLADGSAPLEGPCQVEEVLASGYSYQGELVRRALVKVRTATT